MKQYKPILELIGIVAIVFGLHYSVFWFFQMNQTALRYPLALLYLIFLGLSIVVFTVVLRVKEKSFDNVGMSFLLVTSLKLVLSFLIVRPILKTTTEIASLERTNFFITFSIFLAIETILTIRILNKKK